MAISVAWLLDKLGNKLYSWSTTKAVMDFDRGGESGQTLQKTLNDFDSTLQEVDQNYIQSVNSKTGRNIQLSTTDIVYNVGDTITTANTSFNPNVQIGGTWTNKTIFSQNILETQIQLESGVTSSAPEVCKYMVVNGICIVTFYDISCSGPSTLALNLPHPIMTMYSLTSSGQLILINPGEISANASLNHESFQIAYPAVGSQLLTVWTKTA